MSENYRYAYSFAYNEGAGFWLAESDAGILGASRAPKYDNHYSDLEMLLMDSPYVVDFSPIIGLPIAAIYVPFQDK